MMWIKLKCFIQLISWRDLKLQLYSINWKQKITLSSFNWNRTELTHSVSFKIECSLQSDLILSYSLLHLTWARETLSSFPARKIQQSFSCLWRLLSSTSHGFSHACSSSFCLEEHRCFFSLQFFQYIFFILNENYN